MTDTGFMNIQDADPDIIVDLKYATTDNFTGKVIYDFTTAIARTGTAQKLGAASRLLKQKGYRLKVWDAFRPVTAQAKLFDVVSDPTWVAKPNPNYSHQKGVTFDLTLTDMAGHEVEMQSGFDDFTGKAVRDYPRTATQEANYQTLLQAMTEAGFVGYENEWWDYRDTEMDSYGPLQADPNDYAH
ncbi:D-Ala-D-Ala dipeptidase [Secundilactobacillus odoratitofui DSM 19909 = JCM 15043]|uniref:D-alanyl-D-alanine dipeptidase n=1 Tax=Secundilactobacillus odoratitofui DSM 19909 = JCM 15043 TaxID=1423776 RepID=A0A0R1M2P8_9LACO|nr:M15 family metallopeptidase [Secundilactobacillus odoratitofui]KRK98810.1 D-Ala-D-Ala dipeptidase [Secundilactobacillus odoratitofui DSM 19909 = JCM 15043]